MSARSTTEARRAGWMILGLLAIPVVSVSSVALLADVASTTDPTALVVGIPATLGGLVMGALVFRVARAVHSGAVAVRALLSVVAVGADRLVDLVVPGIVERRSVRPVLVLMPARVGRRGPPVSRR